MDTYDPRLPYRTNTLIGKVLNGAFIVGVGITVVIPATIVLMFSRKKK